jgi:hypothetical protein
VRRRDRAIMLPFAALRLYSGRSAELLKYLTKVKKWLV